MLQISDAAVSVLEDARSSQEVPEDHGVRVFGQPTESGEVALSLAFVEEPAEDDQVTERAGTRLFVAPEVAEPLSESVIDLEQTEQGPQLVVKAQDEAAG